MEEILKKLLNRIKQEESDIQALQKKLFKEKLKTALLNCELATFEEKFPYMIAFYIAKMMK